MIIVGAIILLVLLMISGVAVPLAFLGTTMFIVLMGGYDPSFLLSFGFTKLNTVLLLTVPLFVLAGIVMEKGQLGEKLIGAVGKLCGKRKGVLGVVAVVSCAVFGAISGSGSATLTCIGGIMAPRMREAGYERGHIGALLANAGLLGLLIPPSATMILYAWVGNQSVLACFLATVIPGIILATLFCLINIYYAKKHPEVNDGYMLEKMKQQPKSKRSSAVPAMLMPVIILGSIYTGILTPTEAAAISVVYALPVSMFYYRAIKVKDLKDILVEATRSAGVIMIMLFAVQILSRMYVSEQLPQMVLNLMFSISDNPTVILIIINVFVIFVGMLMDDISAILLCTPLLLPIAQAIGISPIHFAAIIGVNVGLGSVTPPTAPMLYLGVRVADAPIVEMLKPNMIMILFGWLPTLLLTTYIPQLSMFLPTLFGYV